MPSLRRERVRELLKRTVGDILRRELSTEECGLVGVNDVGVANDLHSAAIFVSVLGSESQQYAAQTPRTRPLPFPIHARREVAQKYTPRIRFELNDAIAEGDRVISPRGIGGGK